MAEKVPLPTYETLLTEAIRSLAIDSGTVSVPPPAGIAVLQDDSKNWATNVHTNRLVKIIRGVGVGQLRVILSNSDRLLTLNQPWIVPPNQTSVYVILGEDFVSALLNMNLRQWGGTALTGRDITTDLANITKLIPIAKAAIFNTALPAPEANWLGADISPTNSPSYLRIYACVSVAGILRVARTVGGVTLTENLNGGNALAASAAYMFTVPWRTGDSINIRYSVTAGTINRLLIDEIGGAE